MAASDDYEARQARIAAAEQGINRLLDAALASSAREDAATWNKRARDASVSQL